MQNLQLLKQVDAFIDQPSDTAGLKLLATDPETNHAFVITTPDNALIHLDLASNNVCSPSFLSSCKAHSA